MEFQLHTTFPLHLEPEWNALIEHSIINVPFIRHEYLRAWWQTRGGGEWPQAELVLVTAHRGGQLVGVAPLFKAQRPGGKLSLFLLGSIEISDYLDLIVRPDDLDEFLIGLLNFLGSPPVGSGRHWTCTTSSIHRPPWPGWSGLPRLQAGHIFRKN